MQKGFIDMYIHCVLHQTHFFSFTVGRTLILTAHRSTLGGLIGSLSVMHLAFL